MEPTSTTRTVTITGMTGGTCVEKVTGALLGVPGVSVQTVRVGIAVITSPDLAKTNAACAAIDAAGFKATPVDSGDSNKCARPAVNPRAARMNGHTPLVPAAPTKGAAPLAAAPAAAVPVAG